jgi:hypothetical protein
VTVASTLAAPLAATAATPGKPETFQLIHNPNGTISLLARANNRYVTAKSIGASALTADGTAIGPWQQFTLIADN